MVKKGICEYYNKNCGGGSVERYEKPKTAPQKDPNKMAAEKFNQTCKIMVVLSDGCPHCVNFMNHAKEHNLNYTRVEQDQEALYKEILQACQGGVPGFKVSSSQFPSGSVKFPGYGGSIVWLHDEVSKRIAAPAPAGGGGSDGKGKHPINAKHGTLKAWLSQGCPWCSKMTALLDENNVQYQVMDGPPPKGNGVPQIQSATNGKVCVGYRDMDGLAKELD